MVEHSESLDVAPPPRRTRRWRRFIWRRLPSLSLLLLTSSFLAVVLYPYVVKTVPSGMVGVLWKRFNGFDMQCWCFVGRGTVLNPRQLRDEGLHLVWPWDKLFQYNLRLQSTSQTYNAITKDGVNVAVQISIRFQLLHNSVGVLHKFIGPQYLVSIVAPEIGSRAREVISQYTAEQVYTSRETIQAKIQSGSQANLEAHLNTLVQTDAMEQPDPKSYTNYLQNSIRILDTLVLSIELPPDIVAAINRQTQQFYEIQEYKYRVEREAQESRRKHIEANGIAAFQKTVSQGISDSYLRWRGIEATLALAKSNNTKIVVIGSGKDGLPIILGNMDNPPPPGPASKALEDGKTSGDKSSSVLPLPTDGTAAGASAVVPSGVTSTQLEKKSVLANPAGAPQAGDTPSPENGKSGADPSAGTASPGEQSNSLLPLGFSDIKSTLSRITEALRPTKSATNSGTGPQPKP